MRLQILDWQHIDDYYKQARESGRLDGNGGLAERTLLHHHRILDNAMKYAVKKGLRRTNPCESVDTPSPRGSKARSLDAEEMQALIDTARGGRMYAPVVVDYTTGLRRGELLGLRWSDINLTAGTLTVAQVVQVVKKQVSFKEPKSECSLLRHTHAAELLAAKVNPRLVSDRLGHSTVAFTLDVYGHVIPDMEQDALDKIGANVDM